ncbi:hypothetical protein [Aurantimonas sp. VKM B-3413]|uniref:hypothetical protein n=1 Tax=Aurantimonas sp. VKM B-3413 TaxID=2779401 RepID=UPI001E50767C|nr:hypothetical protein [Aurantimonas sp. VKM B-3413]MCB8835970.1 hypothetical protein [Aurantimonas sp. VKM B-3413]
MTAAFAATVTGRAIDFAAPIVEPAHLFSEIAHGLSFIARFAGQTPTAYSVAQHSVLMAEAAEDETGEPALAAYCLLHHGHTAYLGDTPWQTALAIEAELIRAAAEKGVPDMIVDSQIARWRALRRRVEARLDAAIHRAAGLEAIDDRGRAIVQIYDVRALTTERRDLFLGGDGAPASGLPLKGGAENSPWPDLSDAPALPLRQGRIRTWPPGVAAERFVLALTRLCPDAALAAGRLDDDEAEERRLA